MVSCTTLSVTVGERDSVDVCWHRHAAHIVCFLPPFSRFSFRHFQTYILLNITSHQRLKWISFYLTNHWYLLCSFTVSDKGLGHWKCSLKLIHSTGICYLGQSPDLFTVGLLFLTCPGFMPHGGRWGREEGPLKVCPFLQSWSFITSSSSSSPVPRWPFLYSAGRLFSEQLILVFSSLEFF